MKAPMTDREIIDLWHKWNEEGLAYPQTLLNFAHEIERRSRQTILAPPTIDDLRKASYGG